MAIEAGGAYDRRWSAVEIEPRVPTLRTRPALAENAALVAMSAMFYHNQFQYAISKDRLRAV